VRIGRDGSVHLTYCTNIHPADGWDAVLANLRRYAPLLKARFSPAAPFGVGLRLSAREARELATPARIDEFRTFLSDHGLYVAIINGFPYGAFHGTHVKAQVYAPDWRDDARVSYTGDLVEILTAVMGVAPAGTDGGISTAPLSYKRWLEGAGDAAWTTMTRNVARAAEALVRASERHGASIHLDIEPEPDCAIENTQEAIAFFQDWLLPTGAPFLAGRLGVTVDAARDLLLRHIRVCFDCCHFAVEYEDPAEALDRLAAAGISIGRVQLSSALDVTLPADRRLRAATVERLRAFADSTYLHQVVERRAGALRRYPDLGPALDEAGDGPSCEWRIHFHVPLFTREYEAFGSTQAYVARVIDLVLERQLTNHLEIETYTWDVLPAGLKLDVLQSIEREYEWVLAALSCRRQSSSTSSA
jgi:sugar phosphate isomerase/epimerase